MAGEDGAAPTPASVGLDEATRRSALRRMRMWLAIAVAVATLGAGGTQLAAESVAQHAADESHRQFATDSAAISSTLKLAIQHEEDLIISASAFVVGDPDASNAEFGRWANSVSAYARYPELLAFGEAVIVARSQLAAFAARAVADPIGPLAADGTFRVIPPGDRPFYCFASSGLSRTPGVGGFPAGFDFCAVGIGQAGLAARDSGQGAYTAIKNGSTTYLAVLTPVYRTGTTPATLAARRADFVGWIGTEAMPEVLLQSALAAYPDTAVTFTYQAYGSTASFSAGAMPSGAASLTTDLHNGWTVKTFGPVASASVFDHPGALALLIAGIALSAVLAALIFVLATGRVRALSQVGVKAAELRYQAMHDPLTGLPNRTLVMDRFEQMVSRNRRHGSVSAVLYLDIDGFKTVNETLGHAVGDRLLQAFAARLISSMRDSDTIGRMGGDEFVVLIDGTTLSSAPELVAERALDMIRQPFEIDGTSTPLAITASVGIASGQHKSPDDLLREADMALYRAKAIGKNCSESFHPEIDADLARRYELEFDLRIALDHDQFFLVYQPIYRLDDLAPVATEALLRWRHPTLGVIAPDEFIPLLEANGQILEVGRWVMNAACAQTATWRERGLDLRVCVNVSGRQLDRETIVDEVRQTLDRTGLDPQALTVEITETALTRNIDATARRLHELKALGVQIAIDDFGTGYCSLAYLQRFPADCLKIDRTFTNDILRSGESDVLIHTLVQLGKDLGLTTLAEGVETNIQIDHLRGLQVDLVQGFLLARPLEPDALERHVLRLTKVARPAIGEPVGIR